MARRRRHFSSSDLRAAVAYEDTSGIADAIDAARDAARVYLADLERVAE